MTRSASTAPERKATDTALLVIGSILLFGIYSFWDLRPPCTEAEPPAVLLNCQICEARRLQPPAKGIRIHRCIAVTQVDQPKEKGVHAIKPSEDTARTKHPPSFGEQAVLRRDRRNVVEHRKRDHAGERTVGERHSRSVTLNNSYVRAAQPLAQGDGCSSLYFQNRQPTIQAPQQICCNARPRTYL